MLVIRFQGRRVFGIGVVKMYCTQRISVRWNYPASFLILTFLLLILREPCETNRGKTLKFWRKKPLWIWPKKLLQEILLPVFTLRFFPPHYAVLLALNRPYTLQPVTFLSCME